MAETPVRLTRSAGVGHAEALESPCRSCPSWCCTRLSLHNFWVRTLIELDHAWYLLNFDSIELGLSASGEWSAYYLAPCRLLTPDGQCSVHATPAQPMICASYNEHACWYKRVLPNGLDPDFIRVDRRRMAVLVEQMRFDDAGTVLEVPTWEALHDLFADLDVDNGRGPIRPPVAGNGHDQSAAGGRSSTMRRQSALAVLSSDPCDGCSAYCCTTLVFPLTKPSNLAGLDFVRFALGFPGVEVVIGDEAWSLVVRTRCRYLDEARCSIYGRPERPIICRHYEARTCSYKTVFGPSSLPGSLRVRFDDFDRLLAAVDVEQDGRIAVLPSTEELQRLFA